MHSNCIYIYILYIVQNKTWLAKILHTCLSFLDPHVLNVHLIWSPKILSMCLLLFLYSNYIVLCNVCLEWSYKVYKNAHLFLTVHLARNIQIHSSYSFGSVPTLSDGTKVRTAYCWQIKMTKVSLPPPPIKVNKMKKCYHALHYCIANTQGPCLT